jgi:hypothetical protein
MAMKPVLRSLCLLLLALAAVMPALADDFKPISKDELALKDNPATPGAHAMILELNRIENDDSAYEEAYYRIKIFTEEGKKRADVEIPFFKNRYGMNISGIKARTIRPDGTVVPFNGKVFEKTIVKNRDYKYLAKTFTLPEVTPGSIIEYRYRLTWDEGYLFNTSWTLQEDLYIKHAYFKIMPSTHSIYGTLWQSMRLPEGKKVKSSRDGQIELELDNIPAFDEEGFSPPEKELKPRLDFFYREEGLPAVGEQFWKDVQKEEYNSAESFIGHRGGIANAVTTLVTPGDSPEQKLRKLYAKVQTLRNTSYEREKTEQEQKRDKSKNNKNSEDVLNRGYGDISDMNGLFVALVRAAGYQAHMVKVSERDETFFDKAILNSRQLDSYMSHVVADGKEYWLDPGTPFCPFGLLPWRKTGVAGLLLDTKDKANFIRTPNPSSADAIIRRVANLKFADGMFKGEIQLIFSGQEALVRRIDAKREDEQSVKEDLENYLKGMLPGGSTLKLKKMDGLNDDRERLTVVYDAEVPNPPAQAGSRYLMPTSLFEHEASPFRHETRKHAVYFKYPYQVLDAIGLTLPPEFRVEALPDQKHEQSDYGYFDIKWEKKGEQTIVTRRGFAIHGILYPLDVYPQLRDFYSKVGSGDEENVVLRANQSAAQ